MFAFFPGGARVFAKQLRAIPLVLFLLAGCASPPQQIAEILQEEPPQKTQSGGKYYLDDGPPVGETTAFADIPDAVPKRERINPARNRPYSALGKKYIPDTRPRFYRARGSASWYGKRYHGRKTSSGEVYDMYKMTAAHPTLAIPGYARVTRVDTGKSVVVRVNDRGPFLGGRIIDLSYAAAGKLGFIKEGTAEVVVETVFPPDEENNPPAETAALPQEELPSLSSSPSLPAKDIANPGFYVQLGAFALTENAERFLADVSASANTAVAIRVGEDGLHRVAAGPYSERALAKKTRDSLCAAGWCGVIREYP